MRKKAFTLIELLVVIAIIGILAGTIIVALNSAKKKAKDAKIKTYVSQIRVLTANYQDTNGVYGTISPMTGLSCNHVSGNPHCEDFATDSDRQKISQLAKDICKQQGGTGASACPDATSGRGLYINASANAYSAQARLLTPVSGSTEGWYCVDSTGKTTNSKAYSSGTACP